MYRTHQLLVLVALFVGFAHSWDIAVSVGDRLEFYTNGIKIDTVHFKSHNLTALAYDDIHNMMLFVDKQIDNDAVCGYNLASKEIRCFIKRNGSNIQDIAFEPTLDLLFFTDTKEGSINWISLKDQGFENNVYGNLLIKIDDRTASAIALDSCGGYIYWINTDDELRLGEYMERARFNGSEREVVNQYLPIFSFAIDPQTQKNYYVNGYVQEFHNEVDLGKYNLNDDHSKIIFMLAYLTRPKELTISKDYVYWMNSNVSHTTVWQRPKNTTLVNPVEPREIIKFCFERPLAIAAHYRIKEQVQGLQNCETLSNLVPVVDRLEVSGCLNYCFQGICNFNDDGRPECRCNAGYSGERCEVCTCHNYCLNDGDCSLNEEDERVCQCVGNYVGSRCEAVKNVNATCS